MSIAEDRRSGTDRRQLDAGPPPGMPERRRNMTRRTLDIDAYSLEEWLAAPRPPQSWDNIPPHRSTFRLGR